MLEISRRNFLRGTLALTIVPIVPTLITRIPIIYSNGFDDDTEGLQALLDGRAFSCENLSCTAIDGLIRNGTFIISKTLNISREDIHINSCLFKTTENFDGGCIFTIQGTESIVLTDNTTYHKYSPYSIDRPF